MKARTFSGYDWLPACSATSPGMRIPITAPTAPSPARTDDAAGAVVIRHRTAAAAGTGAPPRRVPGSAPQRLSLPAVAVGGMSAEASGRRAGTTGSFADYIEAVDTEDEFRDPLYTAAAERVLAAIRRASGGLSPSIAMITGAGTGTDAATDTAATALALSYRSAMLGQRTLLVDAAIGSARLSQVFAAEHAAFQAARIRAAAGLEAILVRDGHSGLVIAPLAGCRMDAAGEQDADRLTRLLRALMASFDVVVIDAGSGGSLPMLRRLAASAHIVLLAGPTGALDAQRAAAAAAALDVAVDVVRLLATDAPRHDGRAPAGRR